MSDPQEDEVVRPEIARRAYLRFCDRGCGHGNDVEDWLAAEREVLAEQENGQARENEPADPHP